MMLPNHLYTALLLAASAGVAAAQPSACDRFGVEPALSEVWQTCQALDAVLPQQQWPPRLDCAVLQGEAASRCTAFRQAAQQVMQQPANAAAYADYRNKAAVLAAWVETLPLRMALMTFHAEHGRLPATLAALGSPLPPWQHARAVTLLASGEIVLSLPAEVAAGGELRLLPQTDANGLLVYQCQARGVAPRLLPPACRAP